MYKLLYPSIRVRTVHPVSVRVRVRLVLLFCALKLITINEGAPSFEFVCRRKYSEWAIVNDSLGLKNNIKDWP